MWIGNKRIKLDEFLAAFYYFFEAMRDRHRIKLWLATKPKIATLSVEGLKDAYQRAMCPRLRMPGDEAFRRLYAQLREGE